MNEQEFRYGRATDVAAKLAAERICDSRRMSMPQQDFVGRGTLDARAGQELKQDFVGRGTLDSRTVGQELKASELEHQISELEVSANRLEQVLETTVKRLDPVIAKYPSDGTEGSVDTRPERHSYVGHRLQQVQVRLDNLYAGVAALNDRLVV